MKKIGFILAAFFVISAIVFAGCGKKPQDTTQKLELSEKTLTMQLFEEKELIVSKENISADLSVVWMSSDESIVKVFEGKLSAVGVGTATVTVKIESLNLKDSAAITVERGTITPVFTALDESVSIYKGSEYPLDLSLTMSGAEFTKGTVTFVTEGSKVSVSNEGVITALDYGNQDIVVKVIYNNITLVEKTVSVTVFEHGVIQTGILGNSVSLRVTNYLEGSVKEFLLDKIVAKLNGNVVDKPITFTVDNADVIDLVEADGYKKIVAKKEGLAKIKAEFVSDSQKKFNTVITVTVTKETIKQETNFFTVGDGGFGQNDLTGNAVIDCIDYELKLNLENVKSVSCGDEEVGFSVIGNQLTLINAPKGTNSYKLVSDTIDVIIDGCIAQKAISTKEELLDFSNNYGSYGGYVALLNDIDLGGAEWAMNNEQWYAGTLDGRGHTISNFVTNNGFIKYSNNLAQVINLQIVNAVLDLSKKTDVENLNVYEYGLLGIAYQGLYENVLVIGKIINAQENQGVVFGQEYSDAKMNNVIILINVDTDKKVYGFGPRYSQSAGTTTENTYLVISNEITLMQSTALDNKTVAYKSIEDLLAKADFSSFVNAGWTVDGGKLPCISDFTNALNNFAVSFSNDLVRNSEVTINSTLYDQKIALKESEPKITIKDDVVYIGDVSGIYHLTISSKSFAGVGRDVELPILETINATYNRKYVVTDGLKTTIELSGFDESISDVVSVMIDGKAVPFSEENGVISFEYSSAGSHALLLRNADANYKFNTVVADFVISGASDFLYFQSHLDAYKYAVIANDIDMESADCRGTVLRGTLDGLGHKMSNLNLDWQGLYDAVIGGTIKNITFDNMICYSYGYLGFKCYGDTSIENVKIINSKLQPYMRALLFYRVYTSGLAVKDCEFVIDANGCANNPYGLYNDHFVQEGDCDGTQKTTISNVKVTMQGGKMATLEDNVTIEGYTFKIGDNATVTNYVVIDERTTE